MTLITLIICLSLEIFWTSVSEYRRFDWFSQYTGWLQARLGHFTWWDGEVAVVTVLLVPLFAVGFMQSWLAGVWLGFFELAFGIAALMYCLRFQSIDRMVDEYCDAKDVDDEVLAQSSVAKIMSKSPVSDEDVMKAVLIHSNDRLFSVLFWFFLLGPLGAFLCRLSFWLSDESTIEKMSFVSSANRLMGILTWVPARLLAFAYAVTGSFEDALRAWREYTHVLNESNVNEQEQTKDLAQVSNQYLYQVGLGALRISIPQISQTHSENNAGEDKLDCTSIRAAHGLVLRTIVAWCLVVALATLAGWFS